MALSGRTAAFHSCPPRLLARVACLLDEQARRAPVPIPRPPSFLLPSVDPWERFEVLILDIDRLIGCPNLSNSSVWFPASVAAIGAFSDSEAVLVMLELAHLGVRLS
ncbi:hypothetical protein BHM03_00010750 [Ensete ventricosum]|uniref:Uncharacterized protein n=1 Tax=Ensete ventricosum TaxID=4639 RepID=A0A445MD42_ENSVE|nr:hypothetical protein BHM03_00010750 [Ensete ventricosum]